MENRETSEIVRAKTLEHAKREMGAYVPTNVAERERLQQLGTELSGELAPVRSLRPDFPLMLGNIEAGTYSRNLGEESITERKLKSNERI